MWKYGPKRDKEAETSVSAHTEALSNNNEVEECTAKTFQ
jgi:hypothetical protein